MRSDVSALVDEFLAIARSRAGDAATDMSVEPLRGLRDPNVVGRRYVTRATAALGDALTQEAIVIAAPAPGGARMVTCTSERTELLRTRCMPLLAAALTTDVPAAAFVADGLPTNASGTFAGRVIHTPEGCTRARDDAGNIDCGPTGQLSWRSQEHSPEPLETAMASVRTQFG